MTVRRRGPGAAAGALAGLVSLGAVACSDSTGNAAPITVPSTVAPTTTTEPDDGVLRVGVLLPLSGPGATIGQSMHDAVVLALGQINDAGGVGELPVRWVVVDEGDGPVSAARALEELLTQHIDAVIGPASSVVALDVLVTLRREGLVTCSPSATALALDDFPDEGLFFRTVPSDSVQAAAMARAIDLTGRSSVTILYVDDAYGRAFTDRLTRLLSGRPVTVEEVVSFRVDDTDFADEAEAVTSSGAQVVAVIGDSDAGPRAVAAVIEGSRASANGSIEIIVNDAMRGPVTGNILRQMPGDATDRVKGVGPHVTTDEGPFLTSYEERFPDSNGFLAVNAFECVDLIALAASAAGSTSSQAIAERITSIATSGQPCVTFAACLRGLEEGRNIDYDGPSGALQLSADGELLRSTYDIFGFDAFGGDRVLGTVPMGSDQVTPALYDRDVWERAAAFSPPR